MPSNLDGFSEDYRPPEIDLDDQEHVTRKSDIWSLGCVYLELCTWYLRGIDGIQQFEELRDMDDIPNLRGGGGTYMSCYLSNNNEVYGAKFFNATTDAKGSKKAVLKQSVKQVRLTLIDFGQTYFCVVVVVVVCDFSVPRFADIRVKYNLNSVDQRTHGRCRCRGQTKHVCTTSAQDHPGKDARHPRRGA